MLSRSQPNSTELSPGIAKASESAATGDKARKKRRARVNDSPITEFMDLAPKESLPKAKPRKSARTPKVSTSIGGHSDDQLFGKAISKPRPDGSLLPNDSNSKGTASRRFPVDMFTISTPPLSDEISIYKVTRHRSMTTEDGTPVFTGMRESGILPRLAMNIFSDSIHAKLSDLQCASYMGTLRWNLIGSKFELTFPSGQGVATVEYESRISNFADKLGPCRKVTCVVQARQGEAALKRQECITGETAGEDFPDLGAWAAGTGATVLRSVEPEWSSSLGCFVLPYDSGSTVASVKNFQLQDASSEKIFSFSKFAKNQYVVKSKLSPFISFALAVSSVQRKLCTQ